jgi:hypothetical protein
MDKVTGCEIMARQNSNIRCGSSVIHVLAMTKREGEVQQAERIKYFMKRLYEAGNHDVSR